MPIPLPNDTVIEGAQYSAHISPQSIRFPLLKGPFDLFPQSIHSLSSTPNGRIYAVKTGQWTVYQVNNGLAEELAVQSCNPGLIKVCEWNGRIVEWSAFRLREWVWDSRYYKNQNINELSKFKSSSLESNAFQKSHSFSSQLISVVELNGSLYSTHDSQCLVWTAEQDEPMAERPLPQHLWPFHLLSDGSLQGRGHRIVPARKGQQFTTCRQTDDWLFVGDQSGSLHIYETKSAVHLKTIRKLCASVLAIEHSRELNTVYYSGSDSKVVCLKLVNRSWEYSSEVRGQSHDVMALCLCSQRLFSGGLTTDLCEYSLSPQGELSGDKKNHISYGSQSFGNIVNDFLILNKMNSFQLWKISEGSSQLMVRYLLPTHRYVVRCCLINLEADQSAGLGLVIATADQTTVWAFSEEEGLIKHCTIDRPYILLETKGPSTKSFIGVSTAVVEKVNISSGQTFELFQHDIVLPTQLVVCSNIRYLLGSKVTQQLGVWENGQCILKHTFSLAHPYSLVCMPPPLAQQHAIAIVKHFGDSSLWLLFAQFSSEGSTQVQKVSKTQQLNPLIDLPTPQVRYCGWMSRSSKSYWWGVAAARLIVITAKTIRRQIAIKDKERLQQKENIINTKSTKKNNKKPIENEINSNSKGQLKKPIKKIKIRTKQTCRIGGIFKWGSRVAILSMNLKAMAQKKLGPMLWAKKIN